MPDREDDPGGGRAALGALYDAHADGLYRYALMILANPAAAEDAVQQAFTKFMDRRGAAVLSEADYLRTCVRNECFTTLRRRRRDGLEPTEPLLEPAAPSANENERLALEEALRTLPPEQREVVHMKVYEGMTFDEIARRTGVPLNTVASRYRYALAKLKERLSASGPGGTRHG
jgi:RNA polymerase sigma-70 factor, ECF subfamily